MTVPRALLVLMMMVMIGICIVSIRGESAKTANRVQRLHHRQMQMSQTLWSQEMELARLRGPEEIRRRTRELGLNLIAPVAEAAKATPGTRTAD